MPLRVIPVLASPARVTAGGLDVTVRRRADPHPFPRRRNRQRSDPLDHRTGRYTLARVILVGKAVAAPDAADPRTGRIDVAQSGSARDEQHLVALNLVRDGHRRNLVGATLGCHCIASALPCGYTCNCPAATIIEPRAFGIPSTPQLPPATQPVSTTISATSARIHDRTTAVLGPVARSARPGVRNARPDAPRTPSRHRARPLVSHGPRHPSGHIAQTAGSAASRSLSGWTTSASGSETSSPRRTSHSVCRREGSSGSSGRAERARRRPSDSSPDRSPLTQAPSGCWARIRATFVAGLASALATCPSCSCCTRI